MGGELLPAKFRKEKGEEIKSMNSFLRKFKPVFRNNRVSIVMILLMLTILILGVSKSDYFLAMSRRKLR